MSPPRSNRRVLGRRGSFASAEEQCSAGAALPPPRSSHRLEGAQLCAGAPRHKYTLYRCRGAAQRKKGGYVAAAQQAQGRHLWRRTAPCSRATARVPLPKKAQGGGGMAPPRSSHRRGGTKLRASEPRLECRWRDGAGGADALAVHTCTCTCYARTTSPRLTRDMLAHASEANRRCLQARYSTEAAGTAAAAAAAAHSGESICSPFILSFGKMLLLLPFKTMPRHPCKHQHAHVHNFITLKYYCCLIFFSHLARYIKEGQLLIIDNVIFGYHPLH